MTSLVAQTAQLFSSPAADSPVRPAVDAGALRPGDVLVFGVFAGECEERLCSDVVSCLNVFGQALYPGRFAGVPASWACHVAIYAGGDTLVHATGPSTTFLLAADDIHAYLAENPRLCTVLRARDAALGDRAAKMALALVRAPGPERRYTTAGLLTRITLQCTLQGRRDAALVAGIRRSIRENVSCLWTSGGLVSCSSLVSTILHVAAEDTGSARSVAGIPCDISPYNLLVELLDRPSWRVVQTVAPAALRSTVLPDRARARAARPPLTLQRSALFVALTLLVVSAVGMAFMLGFGRALHTLLMRRDAAAAVRFAPSARTRLRGDAVAIARAARRAAPPARARAWAAPSLRAPRWRPSTASRSFGSAASPSGANLP